MAEKINQRTVKNLTGPATAVFSAATMTGLATVRLVQDCPEEHRLPESALSAKLP